MNKSIKWYISRIHAMNVEEIFWRVKQKCNEKIEKKTLYSKNLPVTEIPLVRSLYLLQPDINRISINWNNTDYSLFNGLNLFGIFDYSEYRNKWNAGFQTQNVWPEDDFSYDVTCSQREDIGDIRTNWELNRHFQFSALAKSYYISGDKKFLSELYYLFDDWNNHNLFLHGVEWASAMEIAIRVNSWIYTYCFLNKAFKRYNVKNDTRILNLLSHGILVMTNYISRHHSRYSSANNHLIVEMYAVALSGIFYNYAPWKNMALKVMTHELPIQNFSDGVNREMSIHYQSFVMEAYGLLMLQMMYNMIEVPTVWTKYLSCMSEFLCDCCGDYGETVVFGDNDEGKVLDLCGKELDHYRYVLDIMGLVLPQRYSNLDALHENLRWTVPKQIIDISKEKKCYYSANARHYKEGGYTILRSKDHKVLIGIDHAALGFGKLAAHGHADALSFQLFIEGNPIFVDSGTYNYHVPKKVRNEFRATRNHNTVCIDDKNQSEILGPFLWGNRYHSLEPVFTELQEVITLKMGIEYNGNLIERTVTLNQQEVLKIDICDDVRLHEKAETISQIFILGKDCVIEDGKIRFSKYKINVNTNAQLYKQNVQYSSIYNRVDSTIKLKYSVSGKNASKIRIQSNFTISDDEL